MAAIEFNNVSKNYGDYQAISNLDLHVEEGEIYGFLGPNGAGKSTTINLLLDYIHPSDGEIKVLGYDAQAESMAIRQRTGILPEGFDLYNRLTGRKHLEFVNRSKNADYDVDRLAERVSMDDDLDRKVGGYSKGMMQRLALAAALIGEPDLLILDEPSSGLDPGGAREMREIVREEADRGATVFFSSHILEQVEAICDRVGILRDGDLVTENTIEGLREEAGTDNVLRLDLDRALESALEAVRDLPGVTEATTEGTVMTVHCSDAAKANAIIEIDAAGCTVRDFDLTEASLEELFVSYTSRGADQGTNQDPEADSSATSDSERTRQRAEPPEVEQNQ